MSSFLTTFLSCPELSRVVLLGLSTCALAALASHAMSELDHDISRLYFSRNTAENTSHHSFLHSTVKLISDRGSDEYLFWNSIVHDTENSSSHSPCSREDPDLPLLRIIRPPRLGVSILLILIKIHTERSGKY